LTRFLVSNRFLRINPSFNAKFIPQRAFAPSWGPPKPPTDRKDIEFRVLETLSLHDKIDKNSLKMSCHLMNDLGLDSLDLIEVVVTLEDEFKIEINEKDSETLLTVEAIVEYLVQRQDKEVDQSQCPDIEFKEGMIERP